MAQVSTDTNPDEVPDNVSVIDECKSGNPNTFEFLTNKRMIKIQEGTRCIRRSVNIFFLGPLEMDTRVVAIQKNSTSTLTAKARLMSFQIFSQAVAQKCGGQNAKVCNAWYGAPKNKINDIICYGFCGYRHGTANEQNFGSGLHLFPLRFSLDSVLDSEMDETGLRHVLLCEVILGKMEVAPAGSKQFHPSSKEFDSGVDNLEDPTRYIIWNCYTNSHISLSHILSFKFPYAQRKHRNMHGFSYLNNLKLMNSVLLVYSECPALVLRTFKEPQGNATGPSSQMFTLYTLMAILSRYLCRSKMDSFAKHLHDYESQRITRAQLMANWLQLAGKNLFMAVLALYKIQVFQPAVEAGPSRPRRDIPHA